MNRNPRKFLLNLQSKIADTRALVRAQIGQGGQQGANEPNDLYRNGAGLAIIKSSKPAYSTKEQRKMSEKQRVLTNRAYRFANHQSKRRLMGRSPHLSTETAAWRTELARWANAR